MIDIDELKRLLADVTTPGEWEIAGQPWPWRIWGNKGHSAVAYTMHPNDARAIIALHNAAPALIAELEAVRAENEKLRHDLVLEQLHHSIKNRLLDRQAPELKAARAVCEAALECKRINWFPSAELITALDAWQKARSE